VKRVLIIGAQPNSLGFALARQFTLPLYGVATAGISGHESYECSLLEMDQVIKVLDEYKPHIIICTAGINRSTQPITTATPRWLIDTYEQMAVNFEGPINLLAAAVSPAMDIPVEQVIMISSNSAHIARRNSLGYCASKAALSMAVRVAGRELAGDPLVYGYELGLLKGTPMTVATEEAFGPAQSRMVGAEGGLDTWQVARHIVNVVGSPWQGLNGTLQRLDAGEQ
jgi:NAD(P)-dependent dehydrogenase (short-subunit alcohol dehydrogenase family)